MKSTTLDKLAVVLSGICLVHCLILPIAITLLPIFTANTFFEDELFHKLMLWLVVPVSTIALFIGCRKHRSLLILSAGIIGITILIIVAFWGHDFFGEVYEKLATSIGGIILAISHILNYRACQSIDCGDMNCEIKHHH